MKTTPRCRNSPISQNQILVNTLSEISSEGYNAQSKEFVKGVFEKKFLALPSTKRTACQEYSENFF